MREAVVETVAFFLFIFVVWFWFLWSLITAKERARRLPDALAKIEGRERV